MKKLEQIYEGKAKKVFATDNPDYVIVSYKDDATAFNGQKRGTIVGKGVVNNKVSNHFFNLLESKGIPTHYVEQLSDRETVVKKVSIVPVEVIIRNKAAGSFSKRMGVPEGSMLARFWSSVTRTTSRPVHQLLRTRAGAGCRSRIDKIRNIRLGERHTERISSALAWNSLIQAEFGRFHGDHLRRDIAGHLPFLDIETGKS